MMYWWHLVHLDQSEVLYKFYIVQKLNNSKDDWVCQLDKDKKDLGLDWTDEKIKTYSKGQFRNLVRCRIEINAGKHLEGLRSSHSKTEKIKFVGFIPAEYFLSKNLMTEEVKTLFKLRTRMVEVKGNFKNAHRDNMWCRLCHLFSETQQHLLECPVLRVNLKNVIKFQELDIDMIFGGICNQEKFVKKYLLILQKRKDLLEKEE